MWKSAYLIAWATMGKKYPQVHEKANPELAPPKPRMKVSDELMNKLRSGKKK